MDDGKQLYAEVIIAAPIHHSYTYAVPDEMHAKIAFGSIVWVPFGRNKILTGIVIKVKRNKEKGIKTKEILRLVWDKPLLFPNQYKFWQWLSEFYMCSVGAVMNAALPAALKPEKRKKIRLNKNISVDNEDLDDREYLIIDALQINKTITLEDAGKILGLKDPSHVIQKLSKKGLIFIDDVILQKFKPKLEEMVSLSNSMNNDVALRSVFDTLEKRAPAQLNLLMRFIDISRKNKKDNIPRNLLLHEQNEYAALKALEKKGIFETMRQEVSRMEHFTKETKIDFHLTKNQKRALEEIKESFTHKKVALLHGVTSSGKTEIYIHLIMETIQAGKQVLFLLPEIALSSQLVKRLSKFFGNKIRVYHSRYNSQIKMEVWNSMVESGSSGSELVMGARSALFLPFNNLGLVIIDEENEPSFKQSDPAPRYHARDSAIYLATLFKANVVLGSATPSIESYHNAVSGKYSLVNLNQRYGEVSLPLIEVIDLKKEFRQFQMQSFFSKKLLKELKDTIALGKQVMLFQNRRGFVPRIECNACNFVFFCENCDVSLTYHKGKNQLRCHYCGYSIYPPDRCPECDSTDLTMKGLGTEKIEEELEAIFPEVVIKRMDSDTTRKKDAHHQIITAFENQEIQVLVGTQMITKGLHFENVQMVGILQADNLINFPDFRSFERAYQMMAQVAGRAGRKKEQGKVLIQTFNPAHPVIKLVTDHNFEGLYRMIIADRYKYKYPPYTRIIQLTLVHGNASLVNVSSERLVARMRNIFGKNVLGPEYPAIPKIKNKYMKNILIKIDKHYQHLPTARNRIVKEIDWLKSMPDYKNVRIIIDVDPYF